MPRYVIQSEFNGCFLAASDDGVPEWVIPLREAGVLDDIEHVHQLIEENSEPYLKPRVIDLDELHNE